MKNRKYKKEQRTPLFEESNVVKKEKKRLKKQKYNHKSHWLLENDADDFQLPIYKDEEEEE